MSFLLFCTALRMRGPMTEARQRDHRPLLRGCHPAPCLGLLAPNPRQGDSPAPVRPAAPRSPALSTVCGVSCVGTTPPPQSRNDGNFYPMRLPPLRLLAAVFHKTAFATDPVCAFCAGGFSGTFYAATARPFTGTQVLRFVAPRKGRSPLDPTRSSAPLDPRPR